MAMYSRDQEHTATSSSLIEDDVVHSGERGNEGGEGESLHGEILQVRLSCLAYVYATWVSFFKGDHHRLN